MGRKGIVILTLGMRKSSDLFAVTYLEMWSWVSHPKSSKTNFLNRGVQQRLRFQQKTVGVVCKDLEGKE